MKMKRISLIFLATGLVFASQSGATVLSLDFESAPLGTTPPSGWTTVGVGGNGSYETVDTIANPGRSGFLNWTGSNSVAPTVYLVNSGVGFDARQAFSGSFDFYIVEDGNDSTVNFILGDVQNGLTNTSAGEFLNFQARERTFGRRAQLLDGANTSLVNTGGNNTWQIETDQWYSASFTWTPTSGTTGDFSLSWTGAQGNKGPLAVTGYTFDSEEVFFGFGTGRSPGYFDNISITGAAIPEPSTALLGSLGMLALLRRRR